jgi:hypothetical protein
VDRVTSLGTTSLKIDAAGVNVATCILLYGMECGGPSSFDTPLGFIITVARVRLVGRNIFGSFCRNCQNVPGYLRYYFVQYIIMYSVCSIRSSMTRSEIGLFTMYLSNDPLGIFSYHYYFRMRTAMSLA